MRGSNNSNGNGKVVAGVLGFLGLAGGVTAAALAGGKSKTVRKPLRGVTRPVKRPPRHGCKPCGR